MTLALLASVRSSSLTRSLSDEQQTLLDTLDLRRYLPQ
jgi:hypothetical protein